MKLATLLEKKNHLIKSVRSRFKKEGSQPKPQIIVDSEKGYPTELLKKRINELKGILSEHHNIQFTNNRFDKFITRILYESATVESLVEKFVMGVNKKGGTINTQKLLNATKNAGRSKAQNGLQQIAAKLADIHAGKGFYLQNISNALSEAQKNTPLAELPPAEKFEEFGEELELDFLAQNSTIRPSAIDSAKTNHGEITHHGITHQIKTELDLQTDDEEFLSSEDIHSMQRDIEGTSEHIIRDEYFERLDVKEQKQLIGDVEDLLIPAIKKFMPYPGSISLDKFKKKVENALTNLLNKFATAEDLNDPQQIEKRGQAVQFLTSPLFYQCENKYRSLFRIKEPKTVETTTPQPTIKRIPGLNEAIKKTMRELWQIGPAKNKQLRPIFINIRARIDTLANNTDLYTPTNFASQVGDVIKDRGFYTSAKDRGLLKERTEAAFIKKITTPILKFANANPQHFKTESKADTSKSSAFKNNQEWEEFPIITPKVRKINQDLLATEKVKKIEGFLDQMLESLNTNAFTDDQHMGEAIKSVGNRIRKMLTRRESLTYEGFAKGVERLVTSLRAVVTPKLSASAQQYQYISYGSFLSKCEKYKGIFKKAEKAKVAIKKQTPKNTRVKLKKEQQPRTVETPINIKSSGRYFVGNKQQAIQTIGTNIDRMVDNLKGSIYNQYPNKAVNIKITNTGSLIKTWLTVCKDYETFERSVKEHMGEFYDQYMPRNGWNKTQFLNFVPGLVLAEARENSFIFPNTTQAKTTTVKKPVSKRTTVSIPTKKATPSKPKITGKKASTKTVAKTVSKAKKKPIREYSRSEAVAELNKQAQAFSKLIKSGSAKKFIHVAKGAFQSASHASSINEQYIIFQRLMQKHSGLDKKVDIEKNPKLLGKVSTILKRLYDTKARLAQLNRG